MMDIAKLREKLFDPAVGSEERSDIHAALVSAEAPQVLAELSEKHPDCVVIQHNWRRGVVGFTISADGNIKTTDSQKRDARKTP